MRYQHMMIVLYTEHTFLHMCISAQEPYDRMHLLHTLLHVKRYSCIVHALLKAKRSHLIEKLFGNLSLFL